MWEHEGKLLIQGTLFWENKIKVKWINSMCFRRKYMIVHTGELYENSHFAILTISIQHLFKRVFCSLKHIHLPVKEMRKRKPQTPIR